MDELLSAETKNFQSIMSESRKLRIPQYQRDYSWSEEQWEELWNDILKGKKNKNKHYMGAIVFISRKDNILEVVDGQQRLTTIAIIIHSVIKLINELVINDIDKEQNLERINIIRFSTHIPTLSIIIYLCSTSLTNQTITIHMI